MTFIVFKARLDGSLSKLVQENLHVLHRAGGLEPDLWSLFQPNQFHDPMIHVLYRKTYYATKYSNHIIFNTSALDSFILKNIQRDGSSSVRWCYSLESNCQPCDLMKSAGSLIFTINVK